VKHEKSESQGSRPLGGKRRSLLIVTPISVDVIPIDVETLTAVDIIAIITLAPSTVTSTVDTVSTATIDGGPVITCNHSGTRPIFSLMIEGAG
jgi:hypothetical protein